MRTSPAHAGALVHESGMVLIGERHGTNEFPNLVLTLAAAAARLGPLVVALELSDDAREPTAAFVRSQGRDADRLQLLASPSWQQQDGRASQAVLSLVDGLRVLIHDGADIDVDVFDAPHADKPPSNYEVDREHLLAQRLLRVHRRGTTLALTGNIHAELVRRADASAQFVPAAAMVADEVRLVSLAGRHSGAARGAPCRSTESW